MMGKGIAVIAAVWALGAASLAAGFSGGLTAELSLLPAASLKTSLALGYETAGQRLSSFAQFSGGMWVWQEFSGKGSFGPLSWEGHLLLGPSTAEFLYDELILRADLFGASLAFYAAQLSGAVLGGPADGAALELEAGFAGMKLRSITEFGASPTGIEIFHAATGLSREYTTDPRVPGNGLSGEKIALEEIPLCCGLFGSAELYLTKEAGFEYLKVKVGELELWCCPRITTDVEVTFELQTKSVAIAPKIVVPRGCFVPYVDVITDIRGLDPKIEGIRLSAAKLECDLGNVRFKDITVLDRCNWAISTEEYGSEAVNRWRADREGIEYYPEYWELFSLEARGPACCGGEWKAVFNTYFGDNPAFFGWGMSHLELEAPLSQGILVAGRLAVTNTGVKELALSAALSW